MSQNVTEFWEKMQVSKIFRSKNLSPGAKYANG
jgi:hypothetical protein